MGREVMVVVFPRLFAMVRQKPGPAALGLFVFLAIIATFLGVRWADPWGWRQQPTLAQAVRDHWEQANRASDNEEVASAKSHLEALLRICPLNAQAQFLMARTCRRAGDPTGLRHLMLAESLGWPRDQILLERRLLQAESGDTWTVEESLLDELNRLPAEERLILEALVKAYLNNFRFVDAIELTNPWIQRYPHDWVAYLYRGRAYQGLARWEQAIADF